MGELKGKIAQVANSQENLRMAFQEILEDIHSVRKIAYEVKEENQNNHAVMWGVILLTLSVSIVNTIILFNK